jgi:hypothetical protein
MAILQMVMMKFWKVLSRQQPKLQPHEQLHVRESVHAMLTESPVSIFFCPAHITLALVER